MFIDVQKDRERAIKESLILNFENLCLTTKLKKRKILN